MISWALMYLNYVGSFKNLLDEPLVFGSLIFLLLTLVMQYFEFPERFITSNKVMYFWWNSFVICTAAHMNVLEQQFYYSEMI